MLTERTEWGYRLGTSHPLFTGHKRSEHRVIERGGKESRVVAALDMEELGAGNRLSKHYLPEKERLTLLCKTLPSI